MKRILSSNLFYNNSLVIGPDVNHVRDCIESRMKVKYDYALSIYSVQYWQQRAKKMIKKAYLKMIGYKKRKKHLCKAFKYLNNVVKYSKNALDAITWHQYYLNGHTCTLKDFLNITILDTLKKDVIQLHKFLFKNQITLPMWLGETSSAYGGGAPGLSDRYVACFSWLDKLGLIAAMNRNYQVIIRQTFYHGHYALIGEDLEPNPDFWISVLYKRLISRNVLKLHLSRKSPDDHSLRLYAHCSYKKQNSVTVFGLNLSEKTSSFRIHTANNFRINEVHHYILTPLGGKLTARKAILNNLPLRMLANDSLPSLIPVITHDSPNHFTLPAYGMGFWVLVNSTNSAC